MLDPRVASLLFSLPTGILIGLTGMGGASLMTPLLILTLGMKPDLAVGTDLVYAALTKALGATMHWRLGHVDFAVVRRLAWSSLPAGVVGVLAMSYLRWGGEISDRQLEIGIGLALLLSCTLLLRPQNPRKANSKVSPTVISGYAIAVGFLVGLTSVGSGTLFMPFLLLYCSLPSLTAVGTDVFHGLLLISTTAAVHAGVGTVQWSLIPWLLAGSVPGVAIGTRLGHLLPHPALRFALVAVMGAEALELLFR